MITVDTAGSGVSAAIVARPAAIAQPIQPSETSNERSSTEHRRPDDAQVPTSQTAVRSTDNRPVIAGPSPAFEASLLELEADIENVIKRVYAEREQARDGDVVKLDQESANPADAEIEASPAATNLTNEIDDVPYDTEARQAED